MCTTAGGHRHDIGSDSVNMVELHCRLYHHQNIMGIKPRVKISTHKSIWVSLREMNTRVLYFFCKFAIICKSHDIYNIYNEAQKLFVGYCFDCNRLLQLRPFLDRQFVGSDRDEHGCIGSAGYTWSYALHSCVRLWEAGTRFDAGPEQVFLIYSADSTFAEIFPSSSKSVLCKRVKGTNVWKPRKGHEMVSIQNGVTCVKVNDYNYTRAND